jgi:hypothetical protein
MAGFSFSGLAGHTKASRTLLFALAGGAEIFQTSLAIADRLAQSAPGNTTWQDVLSRLEGMSLSKS